LFHQKTNGKFTPHNADISWPSGYYIDSKKYIASEFVYTDINGNTQVLKYWRRLTKNESNQKIPYKTGTELYKSGIATKEKDAYGNSYKRLAKAYALNPDAALQSCSWGAFQILGKYYKIMGYSSVKEFVKAMSRSEREHIRAFVLYCKFVAPQIKAFLVAKNFTEIAINYNGSDYNRYDKKLKDAYKKWSKK